MTDPVAGSSNDPTRPVPNRPAPNRLSPARLDELWDFDDPAGSELRFRRELAEAPSGTCRAELETQLARAVGLQGRMDDASAVLDAVETAGDLEPVVRARLLLERGRLRNSAGDRVASVEYFGAALTVAESAGEDFLAVDAAHMLAIVDPDWSQAWTDRALDIVVESADPRTRRWAGSLHNNAGWAHHDAGRYDEALAEFELALAAYSELGTEEQVRVAQWAVARALRSLDRFEDALVIQRRLAEQDPSDGYVHQELAELLRATGRPESAAEHAAAAAALLGPDDATP
jgi:tetratricopeptide (TPR) repeat protein